ncbi:MAG: DUF2589 domain-containing protein [Bacteroides sp.]
MAKEASFNALVAAIQNAFLSVNQMAENQHLDMLSAYFEHDGTPVCIDIKCPFFNDKGETEYKNVSIPKLCLIPMSSLCLDEINVDFKVKLYGKVSLEQQAYAGDKTENLQMDKLTEHRKGGEKETFIGYIPNGRIRKGSDDSYASISLKFVSQEPPEGLMRIRDEFIKVTL